MNPIIMKLFSQSFPEMGNMQNSLGMRLLFGGQSAAQQQPPQAPQSAGGKPSSGLAQRLIYGDNAQGNYERNPYGDAADTLIAKRHPLDVINGLMMKQKYAEADRQERAEQMAAQLGLQDYIYNRDRAAKKEDREAEEAFSIKKLLAEGERKLAEMKIEQEYAEKLAADKYAHESALAGEKNTADAAQRRYEMGKAAGIEGENLFAFGEDPFGYDVKPAKKRDPKLLSPISWFAGKPSAKAVPRAKLAKGTVQDGHIFMGGDPANPENWRIK
jgi:hypothetical protein